VRRRASNVGHAVEQDTALHYWRWWTRLMTISYEFTKTIKMYIKKPPGALLFLLAAFVLYGKAFALRF
jgi:hypothetical protein